MTNSKAGTDKGCLDKTVPSTTLIGTDFDPKFPAQLPSQTKKSRLYFLPIYPETALPAH